MSNKSRRDILLMAGCAGSGLVLAAGSQAQEKQEASRFVVAMEKDMVVFIDNKTEKTIALRVADERKSDEWRQLQEEMRKLAMPKEALDEDEECGKKCRKQDDGHCSRKKGHSPANTHWCNQGHLWVEFG